jgi:hypothetical protein
VRFTTAFGAALLFASATQLYGQFCNLQSTTSQATCDTAGSITNCTFGYTNIGGADCIGDFKAAFGILDPGTILSAQGTSVLSSCAPAGTITFPFGAVQGHSSMSNSIQCQGTGSLHPGETATITARVMPDPAFSGTFFFVGYVASYKNPDPNAFGTVSATYQGSAFISVQICTATPSVAGSAPSGFPYLVSWTSTTGASSGGGYEVQEATKADFSDAITLTEPTTSRQFQHSVTVATTFYYRVRPISCGGSPGSFASSAQIVVLPQQPPTSRDFDLVVPLGSTTQVSQDITFSGLPSGATFTATTDKPYLTISPSSGTVRSDGTVTVTVKGDPSNLPVGANTGTVILTVSSGKGGPVPNDNTSASKPVSISLVTPVSPVAKGAPPNDALIVPAVAHLEGVVPFRSDVRITNAGTAAATYLLSFTPQATDGTSGRQTTITVQPGQTVALNDVLKDFFGFALSSDQAGGVLDIRTLVGSSATTFVSSRTFAATASGTYGQFIPAVPLSRFLKAAGGALTLTQVSQSEAFRTNIGLVEGLGAAATGRLRVFSATGQSLGEFPFSLRPFEFVQLGSFLALKGITADNARVEAVVDSPTGSITTYASVLDNRTNDPLLVSPLRAGSLSASRYVLPGMADFASTFSNFHSDIRLYNASAASVTATATFYPQGTPAASTTKSVTIAPGEISAYNNVLPTLFGITGSGGSIVVTTPANTSLIVSGRTYSNDAASGGTFGQFIPAVTPPEGVGLGEAPLQVLQLEQSSNFRSNLGLNELTGNPVTVHVALILPDSKTSPSTDVTLLANEFRQLNAVISSLNPGNNTYNARIIVSVVGGTGRVTAYGSVIDNLTSDPTYVPAQK